MFLSFLQRLTTSACSLLRGAADRTGAWVRARPRLAAWVFPAAPPDAAYREFNAGYFGQFGEQERMLADRPRMDFYHAAVARHVRPGDRVVDLGTGTGILAAFAARRGAAKVWAIDHSDILEHARRIARHNALPNVEFVARHSRDFVVSDRVDVILHEQMGDFLFDEGMVANVLDLRDRLLRRDGRIVPSRFEFFCEPVRIRDSRRIPFIWELNVHGYDYSCLERDRPQEPHYYRLNSSDLGVVDCFLGAAEPALAFDLMTLEADELPHELRVSRTVTQPGRLDGCVIFFRARVDYDLILSSSPLDPGRAPHWGFRILRCAAEDYAAGDVVEILLRAPDWSEPDTWRWECTRRPAADSRGRPADPPAAR